MADWQVAGWRWRTTMGDVGLRDEWIKDEGLEIRV